MADVSINSEETLSKSEKRRLESLKNRANLYRGRQIVVSKSLTSEWTKSPVDQQSGPVNKKITFPDSDDERSLEKDDKKQLFSDSDDDQDVSNSKTFDFASKPHYKVMQTKYSTYDERFCMDEKFFDDDGDNQRKAQKDSKEERDSETEMQTDICNNLLGDSISPSKKGKKRHSKELLDLQPRYDPLLDSHRKFVIDPWKIENDSDKLDKQDKNNAHKDKRKKKLKDSGEKFYHFSESLKNTFNNASKEGFSLQNMFSNNEKVDKVSMKSKCEDIPSVPLKADDFFQLAESVKNDSDSDVDNNVDDLVNENTGKFFISSLQDEKLQEALKFFHDDHKFQPCTVRREIMTFIKTKTSKQRNQRATLKRIGRNKHRRKFVK